MPIRNGYARDVFIVTSGEMMALYAASNIVRAVDNFSNRGYARYSGVILNSRNVPDEKETVLKALSEIGGDIVSVIPRDSAVQAAENKGMTVIEAFPQSSQAEAYRKLAEAVLERSEDAADEEDY